MKHKKINWQTVAAQGKGLLRKFSVNLPMRIAALVIAFFVWFGVSASNDPIRSKTFSNIPVTLVNESSIAHIGKTVEPQKDGTVTVKVTERRSILNRLTASDFYVEADLEMVNGLNSVPLTVSCLNSAVTWDDMQIKPAALKVAMEDKVEVVFPITVVTAGTPASNLVVGQTEVVEGKTVRIAGPESLISSINQVTVTVNVANLGTSAQTTAALHVYDKDGAELKEAQMGRLEFKKDSGTLLSNQMVSVKVTLWEVASDIEPVLNLSGVPADGYRVTGVTMMPSTISLAGAHDTLEALGGRLELAETLDIEGVTDNVEKEIDLKQTIAGYDKLKAVSDTTVTVTVQVEKTNSTILELALSDITIKNQPKNKKLVFTPADKISVTVLAKEPRLDPLDKDSLTASMDLAACAVPGEYEIPVEIDLPQGYELSEPVSFMVTSADEKESVSDEEIDDQADETATEGIL